MTIKQKRKVLIIAPYFNKKVAGEAWCTYMWVRGMCERFQATVLTSHSKGWKQEESPIDADEIVNWTHPTIKGRLARLDYELKPHYLLFYYRARKWLKSELRKGNRFEIVHQINPVALRYPSPARNLNVNLILGPHAGSLDTLKGFKEECKDKQWYRKLRLVDSCRIKYDPFLKSSFRSAAVVCGVAPYIKEFLRPAGIKRFEIIAETGAEKIIDKPKVITDKSVPLKLLFVGRIIRTKGVIDAIRAVALASKKCAVQLDIVGTGDMIEQCNNEIEKLGVNSLVHLHGRIPREKVYDWYQTSDVFLFPSFREPSGTVVFEAMGFGLPLITTTVGGPGYVVNDSCGICIEPRNPRQFAVDLSEAIIQLANDRELVAKLSSGALKRVKEVASWDRRYDKMESIYNSVISNI